MDTDAWEFEYDEKNYRTHEYSHMLFEGMSSMNNHLFLKG